MNAGDDAGGGGGLEGEKKVSTAGKEKWSSDRKLRNSSGWCVELKI